LGDYDVYHQWLGIGPEEQPPNHYRLLGVPLFETDSEVIRNAAERQLRYVRQLAKGEFVEVGQKLLNALASAKLCLLDAKKRAVYDQQLREAMGAAINNLSDPSAFSDSPIGGQAVERPSATPPVDRSDSAAITQGRRTWIVGYDSGCDIRVTEPTVSRMHCKILYVNGKYFIRDLNSTNGTFVNNQQIRKYCPIGPLDLVTLGRDVRLHLNNALGWSHSGARVLFVGRAIRNDLRLDDASVSSYHARVVFDQRGQATLEDLHSTNGTAVERDGSRLCRTGRQLIDRQCMVYFGQCAVPSSRLYAMAERTGATESTAG
jgi:pSer/pThr/pTyr-binding forkhead associated (FHA) protein